MEALSFILGIALVVVIAIAIVAIYAFVKVGKLENQIREFETLEGSFYTAISTQTDWSNRRMVDTERSISELETNINRRIDDLEREVFSQLDSRLDKLENKLVNNKK